MPKDVQTKLIVDAPKESVRVNRELARSNAWPSLTKTRGLRALMMLAQSQGQGSAGGWVFETPIEMIRDLLSCRNDKHLKQEFEAMGNLKINWSRFDPELEGYSIPVPEMIWDKKKGTVRWSFASIFAATFIENGKGYQNINWEVFMAFNSVYAAKLYEWLSMYRPGEGAPKPPIQTTRDLRDLLGVPNDQYTGNTQGTLFRLIDRAIKAINEAQDGFYVKYTRTGKGRTCYHEFTVTSAPEQKRMKVSSPIRHVSTQELLDLRYNIEKAVNAAPESVKNEVLPYLRLGESGLKVARGKLKEAGIEVS